MSFSKISAGHRPVAVHKVIEKVVPDTIGAIYHHRDCIGHVINGHPESPARVIAITKELRKQWPADFFRDAPLVEDSQILLFHAEECLSNLKSICDQAEKNRRKVDIDGDTSVMFGSRAAIYRAAGSIIAAVDDIYYPSTGNPQLRSTPNYSLTHLIAQSQISILLHAPARPSCRAPLSHGVLFPQ
jgi:hypothetical protein